MTIKLDFKIESDLFTLRGHARVMKALFRRLMELRVEKFLPKHFQPGPETQPGGAYGYPRPNAFYVRRKQRLKGHSDPLVWSGRLRREALRSGRQNITATKTRSKTRFRTVHKQPPGKTQERIAQLSAITSPETAELIADAERFYVDAAKRPEFREHTRQRIRS